MSKLSPWVSWQYLLRLCRNLPSTASYSKFCTKPQSLVQHQLLSRLRCTFVYVHCYLEPFTIAMNAFCNCPIAKIAIGYLLYLLLRGKLQALSLDKLYALTLRRSLRSVRCDRRRENAARSVARTSTRLQP